MSPVLPLAKARARLRQMHLELDQVDRSLRGLGSLADAARALLRASQHAEAAGMALTAAVEAQQGLEPALAAEDSPSDPP